MINRAGGDHRSRSWGPKGRDGVGIIVELGPGRWCGIFICISLCIVRLAGGSAFIACFGHLD